MSKKSEKKHNFHEKKLSNKFFLWKRKTLFENNCRNYFINFPNFLFRVFKNGESVFLTTSVVFLEQSSKYIDFSLEALAEAFSPTVLIFFPLRVRKHAKSKKFLEKCLFADNAPINTLNTVSATLWKSFAESPKEIRCLQKLQNYTIL